MAYPRSSRYQEPPRQRIDARGKETKEAGLRDAHLGMNGKPVSGVDESGTRVNFPAARSELDQFKKPAAAAPAPVPATAAPGAMQGPTITGEPLGTPARPRFPGSKMQTGDPRVAFKSAAERSAGMETAAAGAAANTAAAAKTMTANRAARTGILRQTNGATGGLITSGGGKSRDLTSVFGGGASSFPKPAPAPALAASTSRHSALLPSAVVRPRGEADALATKLGGTKQPTVASNFPKPQYGAPGTLDATAPRHSALLPGAKVRPQGEADALAAKSGAGFPKPPGAPAAPATPKPKRTAKL